MASPASDGIRLAMVRVIEERPVSLTLADRVAVRHESPQALLIKNGKAVWHDSHEAITAQSLTDAVKGNL